MEENCSSGADIHSSGKEISSFIEPKDPLPFFNVFHLDPSHCITNVHIFPSSVKYSYLYYSLTCFGPLGHLQRHT
jgi:hypothetical protein